MVGHILHDSMLPTTLFSLQVEVCAVAVQFSVKHPYTGHYQAINLYTTMVDKETTFCTIFMNRYLGNATFYSRSRHTI